MRELLKVLPSRFLMCRKIETDTDVTYKKYHINLENDFDVSFVDCMADFINVIVVFAVDNDLVVLYEELPH